MDDLVEVARLFDNYRQFYGQAPNPDLARSFISGRLGNGDSVILLAQLRQASVGFAQLYPSFSSVSATRTWILNDLYVCERNRRHGMGKMLLDAATQYARSTGASRLSLATAVSNRAAQTLYEASGWQRNSEFIHYSFLL